LDIEQKEEQLPGFLKNITPMVYVSVEIKMAKYKNGIAEQQQTKRIKRDHSL